MTWAIEIIKLQKMDKCALVKDFVIRDGIDFCLRMLRFRRVKKVKTFSNKSSKSDIKINRILYSCHLMKGKARVDGWINISQSHEKQEAATVAWGGTQGLKSLLNGPQWWCGWFPPFPTQIYWNCCCTDIAVKVQGLWLSSCFILKFL